MLIKLGSVRTLINMTDYLFTAPNLTEGLDEAIVGVATAVPAFPIMSLFFVFFSVLLGGIASQNRRVGYSDVPMWGLLASLSVFLLSLLMTLRAGILPAWVLGVVVALNILMGFWYFLSHGKGETA